MNRRDFVTAFMAASLPGVAAQSAVAARAGDTASLGPIHMNDLQTFRLRFAPLDRRAKRLWPRVQGNRRLTTVLASASFYLEMAETGMTNLATDDLSAQGWVDQPLRQAAEMLDAVE